MSERFYINWPLQPGTTELEGPEAHHLSTVCRIRAGQQVCLFCGNGREYPARIVEVQRRRVILDVAEPRNPQRELGFPLLVAAPLPRGDRAHFLVEKLTEIGATAFVPLATTRSVVQPHDSLRDKLQRYVIEASKQCGRNVLMHVEPSQTWELFCSREDLPGRKIVAHPGSTSQPGPRLFQNVLGSDGLALAVGPEGGFTEEEVDWAVRHEWSMADLGPRTLRVETAALVMASWAVGISIR